MAVLKGLLPLVILIFRVYAHENEQRRPSVVDPVSNFLSELGDLFLDIDGALAVQKAPKVEAQDRWMARSLQPQKEYFDRIQGNYRGIRNRLGVLIADTISPRQSRQTDPFSVIFPSHEFGSQGERSAGSFNGNPFGSPQDLAINPEEQMKATIESILQETRRTGQLLSSLGRPINEGLSSLVRRSGPDPSSSESRFDRYIRQLINNHGRWLLDNPLLQTFRQRSEPTAAEEAPPASSESAPEDSAATTDAPTTPQLEAESRTLPLMGETYYHVDDDGNAEEQVEVVLKSDSVREGDEEAKIKTERQIEPQSQGTQLLAFTSDGVPLKLRLGPEIQNPVQYLHRILRTAGVTLKLPVRSFEDLEPVGKEVLLLGSGSGVVTRSVYLNLSNPNELRSLLRTLIRSQASVHK